MDGKWGKPSALITGPRPWGIKRVEPVPNNNHDKLMSGSRPIELTLEGNQKYDHIRKNMTFKKCTIFKKANLYVKKLKRRYSDHIL